MLYVVIMMMVMIFVSMEAMMAMIEFNMTSPSESLVEDIDQQFVQKREEDVLWKQEFELILMMHVVLMMMMIHYVSRFFCS